jgi:16S rRNA (guanine527-N7)-methyltransferase
VKRLHALCGQWELPAPAELRLADLLRLLAEDPDAPTSVTEPARAVDVHIADSLSGLPLLRDRPSPDSIVDIGSGAGFPGLPIAVALPIRVDLLEATGRKCAFIERAIDTLALDNAAVVCRRAEEWGAGEGRGRYGAALVRAVGSLPTLLEYGAPLLREGGLLIAWKGRRNRAEEKAGAGAAETLGLRSHAVVTADPFPGATARHLYAYQKVAPTPAGYPRRPGVARKRPLGS